MSEYEQSLDLWAPQSVWWNREVWFWSGDCWCSAALSLSHPPSSDKLLHLPLILHSCQVCAGGSGESHYCLPPSQSDWGKQRLQEEITSSHYIRFSTQFSLVYIIKDIIFTFISLFRKYLHWSDTFIQSHLQCKCRYIISLISMCSPWVSNTWRWCS